jgi:hypothetical protein
VSSLSLVRRASLALAALAIVVALFHDAIALGLVARGDDAFAISGATHAIAYYDRAAFFAPNDGLVADRTASVALLDGTVAEKRHALDRVRGALTTLPTSVALRADRARLARAVHADVESCDAYRALSAASADWQYSEFAAQCARRLGRVADARHAFARVVMLMPSNTVAKRALAALATPDAPRLPTSTRRSSREGVRSVRGRAR